MMLDTETVLWVIPVVLVGIALLAKLCLHLAKRSQPHSTPKGKV